MTPRLGSPESASSSPGENRQPTPPAALYSGRGHRDPVTQAATHRAATLRASLTRLQVPGRRNKHVEISHAENDARGNAFPPTAALERSRVRELAEYLRLRFRCGEATRTAHVAHGP